MQITLPRRWTLKRQLNVFFALTLAAVLLSGAFAVWRIKGFDDRRIRLLASSQQLQNGLDNNFANTRAIGVMRTHLRMYMNSGESEKMLLVHDDVSLLKKSLGPAYHDELESFHKVLEVLDVRMRSLRHNSVATFQAESDIMAISSRLMHGTGPEYFFVIQQLNSQTCLEHHHLYGQLTQSGQVDNIESALQEEGKLFVDVDKKLLGLVQKFSPELQKIVHELRDAYYDLDESVTTVASIRIHTLRTQSEVMQILDTLESRIAAASLQQNEASRTLIADSLSLAQKDITLMYASLILAGIFFVFIALLLNHGMVSPLVRFVELLQNVTRLLTGLRTREVSGDEDFNQLARMANTQHNEIGDVARSLENLVRRLRDLALFRHAIENDETSSEIFQRLGRIFSDKIGMEAFVIYERQMDKPGMRSVCVHPESIIEMVSNIKEKSKCRAWRTGAMASSLETPDICDSNHTPPDKECICLPMRIGTEVMGVVQLLIAKEHVHSIDASLENSLDEVKYYIAETLPVLQSRQLATKLECMATEDSLTGLFNRRYLELSLDRLSAVTQRRNSHVGILMCDVDYFKPVNDDYGHDAGDEVLRQLARILMKYTREMDLVIRYGGEEFLILLVDCKENEAMAMGERIRQAVEANEFRIPSCTLHKTISIGVADFSGKENQEIRDVIKEADVALYQAKQGGRNRVVQSEQM